MHQVAVDLVLAPGGVLLGRAEVLEGAEARDGVEGPDLLSGHLACVAEMDVEVPAELDAEALPPAAQVDGADSRESERRLRM